MKDVVVVGAGMAGLVCAQQLSQAGYSVLVVEKSRGFGGRVATRRLHNTCADHGACYIKPQGKLMTQFVELLVQRNVLQVWNGTFMEKSQNIASSMQARYVSSTGMSSVAKFLAQGLDVTLNERVIEVNLNPNNNQWRLTLESNNEQIMAKALVIAIPAPQALQLLEPLEGNVLDSTFINKLRSVEFFPCISVMAGYPATAKPLPQWRAITFDNDSVLGWIGFDSTKRSNPSQPVFVVQSSADLAYQNLGETVDLQDLGQYMLDAVASRVGLSFFAVPDWIQVHRWRYAFPRTPLQETLLAADSQRLICCGDWCGGNLIGGAIDSGLSAASAINSQLKPNSTLLDNNFLKILT